MSASSWSVTVRARPWATQRPRPACRAGLAARPWEVIPACSAGGDGPGVGGGAGPVREQLEHPRPEPRDVPRPEGEDDVAWGSPLGEAPDGGVPVGLEGDPAGWQRHGPGHEVPGDPRLRVLPRAVHVEDDDVVRETESTAEVVREDPGPAVQVRLEDGQHPPLAAHAPHR